MIEENQEYTSRNEEDAIKQENEDKQPASTTITVRIPYSLKARLYDLSEQSKMTLNAYVATRIYKYVQGEIGERKELQEEVEQLSRDLGEANRKLQTWEQAYEELKKEKAELDNRPNQEQLDEVKQEKDKLAKQVTDLQKQLEKAQNETSKASQEKDKQVKQLEKKVEELKQRPTQKQLDNAKEKIQELKQRPTQDDIDDYTNEIGRLSELTIDMQYYINRHAHGIFKKPYQFVEDVPINPPDNE